MTHPLPYEMPDVALGPANRKGLLMAMGIILICFGAMAGCMTVLMPVGMAFQQVAANNPAATQAGFTTTEQSPLHLVVAMLIYGLIAGGLIWTGIGSIRAQRWVRPIVLIFSTMWLAIGCVVLIAMIISLPMMQKSMQAAAPTGPPGMLAMIVAMTVLFSFILYIVIPGAFLLCYRLENVRLTLDYFDPTIRWTDRCPISVLGMSIGSAVFAVGSAWGLVYPVVPIFGYILKGISAAIFFGAVALAFVTAAILIYRQKMLGWNLAVGLLLLFVVSTLVNMVRLERMEFDTTGMNAQQIEAVQSSPFANMLILGAVTLITNAACLLFAFRIRRHFSPAGREITTNTQ